MNKKIIKVSFYVSETEFTSLKELSGIASISAYIRSKVFGIEKEEQRNEEFNKWVDFLSRIPDRDEILRLFVLKVKSDGNNPEKVFSRRLLI